uniref:Uncharacterized protein n=1 Tax=Arundo donax TaxID=35708 RepID=A0A0A8Z5R9_ARUDO
MYRMWVHEYNTTNISLYTVALDQQI